ncbi:hypothetical protein ATCC90586_010361 [Pythium insidiosum]|nr:hypothetical protein ATCC90586_010361 [Pythium insidiosum]
MSRKFRGRILSSEFEGYDPRHQLELSLRAGIGSPLIGYASKASKCADDKIDSVKSSERTTVAFGMMLCRDSYPSFLKHHQLEPTQVLCWYFAVLALSRRVKDQADGRWPDDAHLDVANTQVHRRAIALIKLAHSGDISKQTFTTLYPDADDRPHAVDLVWFHVERAVEQVKSVRACVRATLDDLIDRYDLMNPASAKTFISPGPVMETWMSDSIVPADVKAKFVREVSVLEDVPDEQKDWHPGSNNQVLDLVHPSLYCCVYGIASVYGLEDESALVQSLAAKKHREELMKERGPFNPKACRDLVFSLCEH